MAVSDITRDAVLAAISEYDRRGQDEFLTTYGFHEARSYRLIHNGNSYDSKAIVGVAHGSLGRGSRPLRADEFSGGDATVGRLLRRLGFTVEVGEQDGSSGTDRARPDPFHTGGRPRARYELDDYLNLGQSDARRQFRAILARRPVGDGERQAVFLPVETLLCFAATFLVNHRHFGGSTAHLAQEPVPSLAQLFRRRPSSILAKMANLDNSRPNGGRWDAEVGTRLSNEPGRFARLYRILLDAARAEGVGPDRLRDFLEPAGGDDLLGQEEIGPAELKQAQAEIDPNDLDSGTETERILAAVVRRYQDRFAREVRENCGERCVFCGFSPVAFEGRRMLVAGHIKPWRASTPREQLDHRNGLAARPTHDAAFDTGLITVDENLAIRVSGMLAAAIDTDPTVRQYFGRPPLFESLALPPGADHPSPDYLAWHRQHIFNRGQGA